MSSQTRYRSGVVAYVALLTVASNAAPIEEGDLVYESGGYAYPASSQADAGTESANQTAFAGNFAGVAARKTGLQTSETSFKLTTDPGYTLVAVSGDWEYPCASTSWSTGDLVGADEASSGTALEDQKVAKVTTVDKAIGIAVVPYNALGDAQTTIIVRLRSALVHQSVSGQ